MMADSDHEGGDCIGPTSPFCEPIAGVSEVASVQPAGLFDSSITIGDVVVRIDSDPVKSRKGGLRADHARVE